MTSACNKAGNVYFPAHGMLSWLVSHDIKVTPVLAEDLTENGMKMEVIIVCERNPHQGLN